MQNASTQMIKFIGKCQRIRFIGIEEHASHGRFDASRQWNIIYNVSFLFLAKPIIFDSKTWSQDILYVRKLDHWDIFVWNIENQPFHKDSVVLSRNLFARVEKICV